MTFISGRARFLFDERLAKAPQLAKTYQWDSIKDFVQEKAIEVAEVWGRLMQAELKRRDVQAIPIAVASAAESTIKEVARYFGLEASMACVAFLNARTLLVNGWAYGSDLRAWRNREFGV